MKAGEFTALTAGLHGLGGQRVWSLAISLFGDLAQAPGQGMDGPLLSAIMGGLQVKPEAARVALHRLRNDGWITSEKTGRISRHSLTEKGRAECAAANPRIYADPTLTSEDWRLALTETICAAQAEDMMDRGFSQLTARVFAGPAKAQAPTGVLCIPSTDAPDWLRRQAAPTAQQVGYEKLHQVLQAMQPKLPDLAEISPVEGAVLRCLVVHNWRRLVLKHPQLPPALVDQDGPAHRCHVLVADLLARYPRPALAEIKQFCAAA